MQLTECDQRDEVPIAMSRFEVLGYNHKLIIYVRQKANMLFYSMRVAQRNRQ